jgi:hypothetical protein
MVIVNNKAWLREHDENHRKLQAMERRQEWMTLMVAINLQWYEGWRGSLSDDRPPLSPLKPWLFNWQQKWGF